MKKTTVASISASAFIALASLFAASGCSTVVPIETNTQVIKYTRGSLATDLDASIDDVEKVTRSALKNDLKFEISSMREDNTCAEYVAKTAFDERVLIRLTKKTEKITTIDIRVGLTGDEKKSLDVFNAINGRL